MLYIGIKLTKMREQIFEAKIIWTVFKAFHIAISAMSTSAILYKCFKNVHTIEGNKWSTKNSDDKIGNRKQFLKSQGHQLTETRSAMNTDLFFLLEYPCFFNDATWLFTLLAVLL